MILGWLKLEFLCRIW